MTHDPWFLAEEIAWRTCCPDQKACPAPTRSMCSRWSYVAPAVEFLTALCAARPDVAAVLKGEAVAVPREATDAMASRVNGTCVTVTIDGTWAVTRQEAKRIHAALVAASPYAREPGQ